MHNIPTKHRNYELDFLKLVFSVIVVFYHLKDFNIEGNSIFEVSSLLGSASVHFFFIVSGMLMANSISKQSVSDNCAKASIDFVLKKFKAIVWYLTTALVIFMFVSIIISYDKGNLKSLSDLGDTLLQAIPELLMLKQAGINIAYNVPTWYISAMLLCMLPLAYMLYRKKNFTLYVFSPLAAVFTFGYMCQVKPKFAFSTHTSLNGMFLGGIVRAFCGLCFGICAYTVYARLKSADFNKKTRILLTIVELAMYSLFFWALFFSKQNKTVMSVILLLPIAIAITFSEQSYICRIFRFRWMRCFGSLSLLIYLNHWVGIIFAEEYCKERGYVFCAMVVSAFMITGSILCYVIVRLGKALWEKKLKPVLTKPEN